MNPRETQPVNKVTDLRRSQRVCLNLPITVFRDGPGKNVASEETHTLIVNAHGTLLKLALTVEIGQLLRIKNMRTQEELVCRVITLESRSSGKSQVGVEFEHASPRFWRIAFPPSDWSPRSPEAKSPTQQPLTQKKVAEVK
ncbi:MAG: hypothetical protein WCE50_16610 [Candidatus Acidiferrum sp.]